MAGQGDDLLASWAPLGAAMLAFHHGEKNAFLVVHSDLWEDEPTPVEAFYRPAESELPELDKQTLAACRGRVLDLGAGAGRHAVELQRAGHDVIAVDVLPEAVAIMGDRGVVDARLGDLGVVKGQIFDTVLMAMNGLGIAGTLRGLGDLLESLPAVLTAGGRLVCDSADLRAVLQREAPQALNDLSNRNRYLGEREFRLSYRDVEGTPYSWLFVDPDALVAIGAAAGFDVEIATVADRGAYLAILTL